MIKILKEAAAAINNEKFIRRETEFGIKNALKRIVEDKFGNFYISTVGIFDDVYVQTFLYPVDEIQKTAAGYCEINLNKLNDENLTLADVKKLILNKEIAGRGLGKMLLAHAMEFAAVERPTQFTMAQDPTLEKVYDETRDRHIETNNKDNAYMERNKKIQDHIYGKFGFEIIEKDERCTSDDGRYIKRITNIFEPGHKFCSFYVDNGVKVFNDVIFPEANSSREY